MADNGIEFKVILQKYGITTDELARLKGEMPAEEGTTDEDFLEYLVEQAKTIEEGKLNQMHRVLLEALPQVGVAIIKIRTTISLDNKFGR